MDINVRVKLGMAYLDAMYGKGWRRQIDKKTLDLANSYSCILGQTGFDYQSHRLKLRLTHREACCLGFYVDPETTNESDYKEAWQRLTKAWKDALRGSEKVKRRRHNA